MKISENSNKPASHYEQNIKEVFKANGDEKMSKKLKLATTNSDLYKLSQDDLNDFRISIPYFKTYCGAIKSFNEDLQHQILLALGVDHEKENALVTWDVFVQVNCFLKLSCTTEAEDIKFICKIFDPDK